MFFYDSTIVIRLHFTTINHRLTADNKTAAEFPFSIIIIELLYTQYKEHGELRLKDSIRMLSHLFFFHFFFIKVQLYTKKVMTFDSLYTYVS
jgi:hypothetical protein